MGPYALAKPDEFSACRDEIWDCIKRRSEGDAWCLEYFGPPSDAVDHGGERRKRAIGSRLAKQQIVGSFLGGGHGIVA